MSVEMDWRLEERIGFKALDVELITLGETGFRVTFRDKKRPDRWYYYTTLWNQEPSYKAANEFYGRQDETETSIQP